MDFSNLSHNCFTLCTALSYVSHIQILQYIQQDYISKLGFFLQLPNNVCSCCSPCPVSIATTLLQTCAHNMDPTHQHLCTNSDHPSTLCAQYYPCPPQSLPNMLLHLHTAFRVHTGLPLCLPSCAWTTQAPSLLFPLPQCQEGLGKCAAGPHWVSWLFMTNYWECAHTFHIIPHPVDSTRIYKLFLSQSYFSWTYLYSNSLILTRTIQQTYLMVYKLVVFRSREYILSYLLSILTLNLKNRY